MSEALLKKMELTELLQFYKTQIFNSNCANVISYANYSDSYSNNSGGSYTNSK